MHIKFLTEICSVQYYIEEKKALYIKKSPGENLSLRKNLSQIGAKNYVYKVKNTT